MRKQLLLETVEAMIGHIGIMREQGVTLDELPKKFMDARQLLHELRYELERDIAEELKNRKKLAKRLIAEMVAEEAEKKS